MSEQRIERWAVMLRGEVQDVYTSRDHAVMHAREIGNEAEVVHLVEIRDGERIAGPGESAPWSVVEEARRERDAAIERAEKAEKAWRYLVKTIDEANADERSRFEREVMRERFLRLLGNQPATADEARSAAVDARVDAKMLANEVFGAKEAKG